ncbi:MAG: 4-(cytidine 5'-diphospho)-2-C-methyl-D-erythritol kinase [Gammaproteobacteria bacterium]|nr:4-(cytidine 5'-diphospho)-2-C-methyl-D-erythritol kinase [Gammaproteobacteria bacterium]
MILDDFVLPAPGKLNLFLHIIGRRPDGFHELQTLFQMVEFADEIRFESTPDSRVTVKGDFADTPPENNLIYKAAMSLRKAADIGCGAIIQVNKKLPIGGGMGGGSSNAATTLIGLNLLWDTNLQDDDMMHIGLQLGADVPLFIAGKTAWGEGAGERLTPLQMPEKWFLVVVPDCHVSTTAIFQNQQLTRDTSPIKIARFLEHDDLYSGQASDLILRNDCEPVVRELYPEIDAALNWLSQWGPARMTGTGASVFSVFHDEDDANRVLAQLPRDWVGIVTRGVNISPLRQAEAEVKASIK